MNFQAPQYEDEFERLCLRLLQVHWKCPTLELFGRRGEEQYGIDIIDLGGSIPLRAAQCKCHEPWKTLPPAEIEKEVRKAKTFVEPLGTYAILTTAKVSGPAQQTIRRLNREHAQAGLFQIEFIAWDQIKDLLYLYPQVANEFYGVGESEQLEV
ncbi:MAG: hypothetical protein MN733_42570, partial [Nitrososphaera sp.]|nr:hypothetical protein [Nitrososphaera sp.]